MIGGRRYEVFADLAAWKRFKERSWNSLKMVEPLTPRFGFKLAFENHNDWRTEELLDLLNRLESEAVGATFDFGNNLALLEDPHEVCEALAPFILSTHVKDMGVEAHEDGFLLSEVPLGDGVLDLKRLVRTCA
ncbi:MAG: TIM barrel protein, partial [Akkermansiaceae bacterium]|nr:TIM barrel protein [Akkermansiaceae bacterium]